LLFMLTWLLVVLSLLASRFLKFMFMFISSVIKVVTYISFT